MPEKIKTWLPVFQGFYDSGLEDDNELEWVIFNDPDSNKLDSKHKDWILENAFEYIDYSGYRNELADSICFTISEELKSHSLISDYKYESLTSPKYYNFSNDSIDVEFEVDIIDLIEKCKKDLANFSEYLKANYTSCSGFMSSYSNDSQAWFGLLDDYSDGLIMDSKEHCIASILQFLLTGSSSCGDGGYQSNIYEACCDACISGYIDYGKMLEDFNEEFGTSCTCLEDIELSIGIEANCEVLARKDLTGQKHFKFL